MNSIKKYILVYISFINLNAIGTESTCIIANPITSPDLIGEFPIKSSPWDVWIEKVTLLGPIADWVATHQLIKYLPTLFITISPVTEL